MSNKILVIGSNSFSGSHFAARASFLGYEVLGISRSRQPRNYFLPETSGSNAQIYLYIQTN